MKIVMCASEMVPFAKTGGLADVAGALPAALESLGQDVAVILPAYRCIRQAKLKLRKAKEGISYTVIGNNIKVYFIENDAFFDRDNLYGDKNGDYKDNLKRFAYYCRKSLDLLAEINLKPDIIHVHDWQACLIPVYLKTIYKDQPFYRNIKTVLTVHNIGYQGLFVKDEFPTLDLDWNLFNMETLEYYDKINILKGGMVFSDLINTVSHTYSKEIQTKEFGYGLEGVLRKRENSLFGILNGLDYSIWNPETDKFITHNFSVQTIKDKYKNKENLQTICNLPAEKNIPLLGIVSRLAEQKGFDILSDALPAICKMDIQMVILGTGDAKYHLLLEEAAKKFPKKISLHLKFDDALAHKIYAGSDIFLMPSKYEPCGLGQMISLRYGTVPLVFRTGGLADTVDEKNGFVFDRYTAQDLIETIGRALKVYKSKKKWTELMERGMQCNFSWRESARQYLKLYDQAIAS